MVVALFPPEVGRDFPPTFGFPLDEGRFPRVIFQPLFCAFDEDEKGFGAGGAGKCGLAFLLAYPQEGVAAV